MESGLNDKRFKHAISDPRFKNVPWKDRKVKIDKRFQSMFTDKRFQIKSGVDERGRQLGELQSENYKKYYELSDSSAESEPESVTESEAPFVASNSGGDVNDKSCFQNNEEKTGGISEDSNTESEGNNEIENNKAKEKLKEAKKEVNKYIDEIHKSKLNSQIRDKLSDFRVDYARGIGTLISDSSSDESSSDESEIINIEHPWGELDKDAEETNEVTPRLAVCNMDWDRVTANDLMVLFHSFLPPDGIIESITIYPSEFGLARMAEEELNGPKELVENEQTSSFKESDEVEEGSSYQIEKLREYQLKRLKYYYAVVICDTKETANTLYTECDGIEYESSAMKLDLRFIADNVTFEQKPHDKCTTLPDLKKYKPRLFVNTALQQGKVDLTWDETDPNRIDFTRRLLAGEEIDENDLQEFVANSCSSEEEEENKKNEVVENDEASDKEEDRLKKYRDLVANLQDTKSKKRDVDMEVTWGVDTNNKEHEAIESGKSDSIEESSEDFDDVEEDTKATKFLKNKKNIKRKYRQTDTVSVEEIQHNDELDLLLADDNTAETGLKHFSLKEIQKKEKMERKKKKWQKNKKNNYQEEDSFKMNPSDERFSAVYTSHQFNIDPADPHFRKTKGMEQLIVEKLKRRKLDSST